MHLQPPSLCLGEGERERDRERKMLCLSRVWCAIVCELFLARRNS
jgi:hypothetical protein